MPGFENHSHQLGSNPVETKAQLRSLTESVPLVKWDRSQEPEVQEPEVRGREFCLLTPGS